MKIIAATRNKGKLTELEAILKDFDIRLISWDEAGLGDFEIEENGQSCEENSYIKAKTICDMTGEAALADDTGLFVDALDGEPGINSARYAGEHGNDAANRKKLLKKLEGRPFEERTAKFVTVITVVYPDGNKLVARGECPGHITEKEIGDRGFGYDSIFVPEGHEETFAQLPPEYKNSLSHRHFALVKLTELLENR
ncbi:MAG: RdgB/HAM1 family non-canonical purine NTP pyrophosphatase [Firmicutes bacterium]|nr:RdgB/HAM1 family non-canonical purine NTP pyrophosphatase [Bacillota bacterium]